MNVYFQSLDRRLVLALAFSMLLHAVLLWLPGISLSRMHAQSSVLTVRMEQAFGQPGTARAPQPKPKAVAPKIAPPEPSRQQSVAKPSATTRITVMQEPASSVAAMPAAPAVASAVPATAEQQPTPFPEIDPSRSKSGIPPLPLHARLNFAVYLEGSSFSIGDMLQELDIKEGRYILQSELEKAGLASWFNSTQLTQISRGTLRENGDLAPEDFMEEATDAKGEHHRYEAVFDWNTQRLHFADGTDSQMPPGTQDMLSILYQLSQYSMHTEKMHLTLTDGGKLKNILLEVGASEEITTPMGKLRALHMSQLHGGGEPWMEIWLAEEYHMLPVRFLSRGSDGKTSQEMVIKEIRVSDDEPVK